MPLLMSANHAVFWRGFASFCSYPRMMKGECLNLEIPATDEPRLLYDRKSAARQLSISTRAIDRLIANKCITARRVGSRVLIPYGELKRFARADHFSMQTACA